MAKAILEKNKVPHRKFVSPSSATDRGETNKETSESSLPFSWKEGAALVTTLLSLRRLPRLALFGVIGIGAYVGYQMLKGNEKPLAAAKKAASKIL